MKLSKNVLAADKFTYVFIIGKAVLECFLIIYHQLCVNVIMTQELLTAYSGA